MVWSCTNDEKRVVEWREWVVWSVGGIWDPVCLFSLTQAKAAEYLFFFSPSTLCCACASRFVKKKSGQRSSERVGEKEKKQTKSAGNHRDAAPRSAEGRIGAKGEKMAGLYLSEETGKGDWKGDRKGEEGRIIDTAILAAHEGKVCRRICVSANDTMQMWIRGGDKAEAEGGGACVRDATCEHTLCLDIKSIQRTMRV